MARSVIELTGAWQPISSVVCTITIKETSGPRNKHRLIYLNETASDDTALKEIAVQHDQFQQTETKPTFAKGEGVTIVLDEIG